MRLIDADALKKRLQEQQKYGSVQDSPGRAKAIVEVIHAPTIDAEPVRHGRWIDIGNNAGMRCSECRYKIRYKNGVKDVMSNHIPAGYYRYCPFCSAKMDGDEDEGD